MKSNNNKSFLFFVMLVLTSLCAHSQVSSDHDFEDGDYYMFPIKPKQNNTLAGSMGELRSTHFHAGLDIRTDSQIGLPVYAAADGYISRAVVRTNGYGRALYLSHPNGETTVYAHLNRFNGPIALHIRNHQYIRKRFKTDLNLKKGRFLVHKGDIIAYSGNSGSSGGPHLHFEIRDKNQAVLNPLNYHFEEIKDTTPPHIERMVIQPFGINSRVNQQFKPASLKVLGSGGRYYLKDTIKIHGKVGFEVYAYDWLDHSRFKCAVTEIKVKKDDAPIYHQNINSFTFSEQKNILAHMDYGIKYRTGKRYHKLYVDNGNFLKFYTTDLHRGKVSLYTDSKHKITVELSDPYHNTSTLIFYIRHEVPKSDIAVSSVSSSKNVLSTKLQKSVLSVEVGHTSDREKPKAYLYVAGEEKVLAPQYSLKGYGHTYLWDMKYGVPDSIRVGTLRKEFGYKAVVPSGSSFHYYGDQMNVYFPKGALFDTLYMEERLISSYPQTARYRIGTPSIPLRRNITVSLKPIAFQKEVSKLGAYEVTGRSSYGYMGGIWKNGKLEFKTRYFGDYVILSDTIPPKIKALTVNKDQLRFQISDKLSGIKDFKATIDGEWVLMNYDYKRKLIWSEKLNPKHVFSGKLVVVVTDKLGNRNYYTQNLD